MRPLILAVAAALPLLAPLAAKAADPTGADLVSAFMLGARDGVTLAFNGGSIVLVLKQSAPGIFDGAPEDGPAIEIAVHDKGACVFDISFSQGGQVGGAVELDASKLTGVRYDPEPATNASWTGYNVTLEGGTGLVQLVGSDGTLSPRDSNSEIGTSLSLADMQGAAATFLGTVCKPPA